MDNAPPVPPRPDTAGTWAPPALLPPAASLANFGQRIGGYFLDVLVMLPVIVVLFVWRWHAVRPFFDWISAHQGQTTFPTIPSTVTLQFQTALRPISFAIAAIWFGYNAAFVAWRGQTFGKVGAHAKVVRSTDGSRVGPGRAAVRAVVPMLGTVLPFPLGLLVPLCVYGWMLFTPRRQGLHDLAAGTVVIRA
jgi:RDD family.